MRIALGLEYDGSAFSGWQRQLGARTAQGALEEALSRVANHTVVVHCAGRTDAGVHALGQVVHFDSNAARSERSWVLGANANLAPDISVLWAQPISNDFHARFSAHSRQYLYVILNRRTRPGLWHGKVTWECRPLDVARMSTAATALVGEHDFSSFRASGCQSRHPVRQVVQLDVSRHGDLVYLQVEANAFLQHMVRNFAGVLLAIGSGRNEPDWAREVLEQRARECAGVTAPAGGLYLRSVGYPERFGVPVNPHALPLFARELLANV